MTLRYFEPKKIQKRKFEPLGFEQFVFTIFYNLGKILCCILGYVIDERINHSDNEQPVDNYFVSELVFDKKLIR